MYMNENISSKQIIAMLIGFSIFILFIVAVYYFSKPKTYFSAKIDPTLDFVYQKESDYSGENKKIPYLNVIGEDADQINEEIFSLEESFASVSENRIGFIFNKSDHILSLAIKMIYYDEYKRPLVKFQTYIIDLITKKRYTDEDIYKKYQITPEVVRLSVEKKFRKMYEDVTKGGYVDGNECKYECFLSWRGVNDYLEGVKFYIENERLLVLKGFATESIFGEEEYFQKEDFKFEVLK